MDKEKVFKHFTHKKEFLGVDGGGLCYFEMHVVF